MISPGLNDGTIPSICHLDLDVAEEENIPGRVYFHISTASSSASISALASSSQDFNTPIKSSFYRPATVTTVESLGSSCIVFGRLKTTLRSNRSHTKIVPFEFALDSSENISVRKAFCRNDMDKTVTEFDIDNRIDSPDTFNNDSCADVPAYVQPSEIVYIKSSKHPSNSPLDSVHLKIVSGNFISKSEGRDENPAYSNQPSGDNQKAVVLFSAALQWKSYDNIRLADDPTHKWEIEEILFDKMTLFTATVSLPKSNTLQIDLGDGPGGVRAITKPGTPRRAFLGRFKRFMERVKVKVEIFLFILLMLAWLVYHKRFSSRSDDNGHFNLYTVLFVGFALSVIALFRMTTRYIMKSWDLTEVFNGRSFFVNGWQAWSFSGSVLHGQKPPIYSMPSLFVKAFHHGGIGTALPINLGEGEIPFRLGYDKEASRRMKSFGKAENKDFVASDMFTSLADVNSNCGVVVGFLSQREQFGCIATNSSYDRLTVHITGDGVLVPSQSHMVTDQLLLYTVDSLENPFATYMSMSSIEHDVPRLLSSEIASKVPAGWCSWYHFYEKISEDVLLNNLDRMKRHHQVSHLGDPRQGFNLFQIDDGYQLHWGDWTELNDRFPSKSLYGIVEKVKTDGFTGGIWMAPFACDQNSLLAKAHPEWILRKNSSPKAACNSANCGKFFYGLDVTNPSFQEHIQRVLEITTRLWGFSYLKLDFLYAAALQDAQNSYYDRTLTRAQIMQLGMRLIRESVEDPMLRSDMRGEAVDGESAPAESVFILGCGAPLGSVIGHVHANRISADAGLSWNPHFPLPSGDSWNLPCARNMVRNTINRLYMHNKWWINDPDCMLLRDKLEFTDDELLGIASVKALSGGSLIISDDFDAISKSRLRILQKLLPPTNQAAVAIDMMHREMPELLRLVMVSNRVREGNPPVTVSDSAAAPSLTSLGTLSASTDEDYGDALSPLSDQNSPFGLIPDLSKRAFSNGNNNNNINISSGAEDKGAIHSFLSSSLDIDTSTAALSASQRRFADPQQRVEMKREIDAISRIKMKLVDKRDLLRRWYLFAACNWTETARSQFVAVQDIFGRAEVNDFIAYTNFLYRKTSSSESRPTPGGGAGERGPGSARSQRSASASASGSSGSASMSTPRAPQRSVRDSVSGVTSFNSHGGLARLSTRISHVIHLFNFWKETYSHKVVTLDEDVGGGEEIPFSDIAAHSAHIFSVNISLHPLLPKYLGSNLHFSCGSEVRSAHLAETPVEMKRAITGFFNSATPRKQLRHADAIANAQHTQQTQQQSTTFTPKIHTIKIEFEDGVLRDASWDGAIWLFLPVHITNARANRHVMGYARVMGSALALSEETRRSRAGEMLIGAMQEPELVEYIEEQACNTAGYVFKIPVCKIDPSAPALAQQQPHLTVSWISDVIDVTSEAQIQTGLGGIGSFASFRRLPASMEMGKVPSK